MVLQTLEFNDCLLDGPQFRDKLTQHEKELDNTNKLIKKLTQEGKELVQAAKQLSVAQRRFATTLTEFRIDCVGSQQTDDEIVIAESLQRFKELIFTIEDARDNMLAKNDEMFIKKLESFRKDYVVKAKDERKKFERATKHYCTAVEKHLKPTKLPADTLEEADRQLEEDRARFQSDSLDYVQLLNELQERKKFEFVEIVLSFMLGWTTFYHQGHESAEDAKPVVISLLQKLQKTRENFKDTGLKVEELMRKVQEQAAQNTPQNKAFTRQGYLYSQEKKTLGPSVWTKYFCTYEKSQKVFTMNSYHQANSAGKAVTAPDIWYLSECTRRATEQSDRRFCFDVSISSKPPNDPDRRLQPMTLQAQSEPDRRAWLDAMDGKEPVYAPLPGFAAAGGDQVYEVNEAGAKFVEKVIWAIEERGLLDQGLYRVVGVTSRINKLMALGLEPPSAKNKVDLTNAEEWEIKTLTSALKNYFRKLAEPVTTFRLHHKFIQAIKQGNKEDRVTSVTKLVQGLPLKNQAVLKTLIIHLTKVAEKSEENLMSVSNLAVCFGPTLLRPEEETVASIMDIKFCNIVVEILIEHHSKIFSAVAAAAPHSNGGEKIHSGSVTRTPGDGGPATESLDGPGQSTITRAGRVTSARRAMASPPPALPSTGPSGSNSPGVSGKGDPPKRPDKAPLTGPSLSGISSYANVRPNLRPNSVLGTNAGTYIHLKKPSSQTPSSASSSNPGVREMVKNMHAGGAGRGLALPGLKSPDGASRGSADFQVYENTTVLKSPVGSSGGGSGGGRPTSMSSELSSKQLDQKEDSKPKRAVTLYQCDAENETELSFRVNEIIYDVKPSEEPGWMEGMLNGQRGMVPENYIKFMDE